MGLFSKTEKCILCRVNYPKDDMLFGECPTCRNLTHEALYTKNELEYEDGYGYPDDGESYEELVDYYHKVQDLKNQYEMKESEPIVGVSGKCKNCEASSEKVGELVPITFDINTLPTGIVLYYCNACSNALRLQDWFTLMDRRDNYGPNDEGEVDGDDDGI